MDAEELKRRTRQFSLEVIELVESLPQTRTSNVIANQLLRSATSVGANYRAACRARSKADFASKIGVTIEEADESLYWLEILAETGLVQKDRLAPLTEGSQRAHCHPHRLRKNGTKQYSIQTIEYLP
jgi:four helix bundle protein